MTTLPRDVIPAAVHRANAVIRAAGGRPMIAGGFVRDAIARPGSPSKDVDIEVYGQAGMDRLAYALAEAGFGVNAVGMSFSVLTVRAGGISMDIAPARTDSKTGEGHRGFTVIPDGTLSYEDACARRDYTVNSMLADPDTGRVVDCHGGLADLAAGVLRHTSPAFSEDPLRVLRGVQFAARFSLRMDPATAALCRQLSGEFGTLATERVWGEFRKLGVAGTDITAGLQVLADTGWEAHFPQLAALHGIRQAPRWHPEGDVWTHSGLAATQAARLAAETGLEGDDRFTVVMAALAHDMGKVTHTQRDSFRWDLLRIVLRGDRWQISSRGHARAGIEPARAFLDSIGCPRGIAARILPLVAEHMNCMTPPTAPAVRRLARRLAPDATMADLAVVIGADRAGRGDPGAPNPAAAWLEKARTVHVEEHPAKGLLDGHDLIGAGLKPGPVFGVILAAALTAQDAGEFGSKEGALAWLARYPRTDTT